MLLELLIAGQLNTNFPKPEPEVKQETSTVQIIEPEMEEPEPPATPPEPSLEEKIKTNFYNCNQATQYIRADNAQCLDKPVYKPQITQTRATQPLRGSQSKGNTYSPGYCTWGVKNWVSWVPNGWGNGNQWAGRASAQGYTVGSNPRIGDVAAARSYNHVAVVFGVGKGTVTIKEMNYKGRYSVNTRTTPISEWQYIRP